MMKIIRISGSNYGTFGVLLFDDIPFCVTLENPWKNNQTFVSCIPIGMYDCKKSISRRFGSTVEICNVPDRSHVLFHWGNTEPDTQGCILLGQRYGTLAKIPAILASKTAFKAFMRRLRTYDDVVLTIFDKSGTVAPSILPRSRPDS